MNLAADRLASAVGVAHVVAGGDEGRVGVRPGSAAEIVDVLRVGRELGLPVGPGLAAGVSLDLSRMQSILHLDGAVKRGFDMVMLTSDLSCMVAGARMQLDELKSKTA